MAKKAKRTTHRSSSGKKLYAVRTADGQFDDIQTYERAHRADLAKTSKAEGAAAKTAKTAKKKAKKAKKAKK
jgi:predicted ABC-class ATPase